jgi:hypothetical protein
MLHVGEKSSSSEPVTFAHHERSTRNTEKLLRESSIRVGLMDVIAFYTPSSGAQNALATLIHLSLTQRSEQRPRGGDTDGAFIPGQPTAKDRLHVGGVIGCNRHHCDSDWLVTAGRAERKASRGARQLPEQPQTNCSGVP